MNENQILDEYSKMNNELINASRELTRLNHEKDLLAQKLQSQIEWNERLVSILAHDLRGPISSLDALIDMAISSKMNNSDFGEILPTIKNATESTRSLLNNILDWISISRKALKISREIIDVSNLVTTVCSWLTSQADTKSIKLAPNLVSGISVLGDINLSTIILRNLVSNAIKFSPANSEVQINVICEPDNSKVHIDVVDNGSGISPLRLLKLNQGELIKSTLGTAGETGSGMGIFFCKDFAKCMDCSIEISSTENQGSTFSLIFPKG